MLILANIAGWFVAHWRVLLYIAAGILILVLGLWLKSCFTKTPKLDEKQIQKAQQAIAENDRKAMQEVLVESDVQEQKIDDNLVNAKVDRINAINEAKKKAAAMSNDELAQELERRAREQQ